MCYVIDSAIDHENWLAKQGTTDEIINCTFCEKEVNVIDTVKITPVYERICKKCCENGTVLEWIVAESYPHDVQAHINELKKEYEQTFKSALKI